MSIAWRQAPLPAVFIIARQYNWLMDSIPRLSRRDLPHIDLQCAVYFVTWRIFPGTAPLQAKERDLLVETIAKFRGERYRLFAWVVMDDHVHVLFQPIGNFNRAAILHSWKSYTANQMQRRFGRKGSVWQAESHDHVVRNEADLYEKWQYILNNPLKRWPDKKEYRWVSSPTDADGFG